MLRVEDEASAPERFLSAESVRRILESNTYLKVEMLSLKQMKRGK